MNRLWKVKELFPIARSSVLYVIENTASQKVKGLLEVLLSTYCSFWEELLPPTLKPTFAPLQPPQQGGLIRFMQMCAVPFLLSDGNEQIAYHWMNTTSPFHACENYSTNESFASLELFARFHSETRNTLKLLPGFPKTDPVIAFWVLGNPGFCQECAGDMKMEVFRMAWLEKPAAGYKTICVCFLIACKCLATF